MLYTPSAGLTLYSPASPKRARAIGGVASQTVEVQGVAAQVSTVPAPKTKQAPEAPPPAPTATPTEAHKDEAATTHLSKDRQVLESKLQPAVLAAFDCFHKATDGGASCAGMHSGNVDIQVWLTEDSSTARAQLRSLGFTLSRANTPQRTLIGSLPVEKLGELAKLKFVRFVSFERR